MSLANEPRYSKSAVRYRTIAPLGPSAWSRRYAPRFHRYQRAIAVTSCYYRIASSGRTILSILNRKLRDLQRVLR